MKRIAGYAIIIAIFGGLFMATVADIGWSAAGLAWGIGAVLSHLFIKALDWIGY